MQGSKYKTFWHVKPVLWVKVNTSIFLKNSEGGVKKKEYEKKNNEELLLSWQSIYGGHRVV